jgi:diguanylate cyclase (GGDEF)-like protein
MFMAELPRELARARRGETPMCLAVIDLDALGAFNMLRGEREGDRLLKEASAAWARQLREIDLIARLEGEQFGIVLPGCGLAEAVEVLDRVRDLAQVLLHLTGVVSTAGGGEVGSLDEVTFQLHGYLSLGA